MGIFELKAPSITDSAARGVQMGRALFESAEAAQIRELKKREILERRSQDSQRREALLQPETLDALSLFGDSSKPLDAGTWQTLMQAGGMDLVGDAGEMRLNDAKLKETNARISYQEAAKQALSAGKEAAAQAEVLKQQNEARKQFTGLIETMLGEDMARTRPGEFKTAIDRALGVFEMAYGIEPTVDANGNAVKDSVDQAKGIAELMQQLGVFPNEQADPTAEGMDAMTEAGSVGPPSPAPEIHPDMETTEFYEDRLEKKELVERDIASQLTAMLPRDLFSYDSDIQAYRLSGKGNLDEEDLRVHDGYLSALSDLKQRSQRYLMSNMTVGDLLPRGAQRRLTQEEVRMIADRYELPVKELATPPRATPLPEPGQDREPVQPSPMTAGLVHPLSTQIGRPLGSDSTEQVGQAGGGRAGGTGQGASVVAEPPSDQPPPSPVPNGSTFHNGEVEALANQTLAGVEGQFGGDYDPSFVAKEMARVMRKAKGSALNRVEMDQIEAALEKMFERREIDAASAN